MIGREMPLDQEILIPHTIHCEPEYDLEFGLPAPPSPQEIARLTAEIRAGWSSNVREQRNEAFWWP